MDKQVSQTAQRHDIESSSIAAGDVVEEASPKDKSPAPEWAPAEERAAVRKYVALQRPSLMAVRR
jgi:hypothetical protein